MSNGGMPKTPLALRAERTSDQASPVPLGVMRSSEKV